ncbi:MBG domain-containing protein [Caulobacter mirabilis]|nr:MBG domain-containing protein [Caulobacter mirabilis]
MPHRPFLTALLTSSALIAAAQAHAQALPTGGTVASGGVTISTPTAGQMTINQSTGQAIVNWQGFSIGQGNSVDIQQPSAQSVLLNRVTGNTPSTIAGSLTANGQVFLVNPNGIAISKTGQVSAAGFVASSLDIADDDFLAGKLTFKGAGRSAAVSNQGAVVVGRGGYAALIGGRIENAGSIIAPLGKVALGAGERATLDLAGDGFLQVAVPSAEQAAEPLIVQSGRITADGGLVQVSAAAARDAARRTVNLEGVIEARSVSGRPGAVVLDGGGGAVSITGDVDASARDGGRGGAITVTGEAITLTGASLDASGRDGGGAVRIGGDFQGQGDLARARTVTIDGASAVTADALEAGNGGRVIVWSDDVTAFSGRISARGGANGGDGGFTEVSGKRLLGFNGTVDLRAPKGRTGDLLLDPYNVTISNAPDTGGFTATGDNSVINVTTLQNALATANVTISTGAGGTQDGDITIAAPISWSANTLTLSAHRSIAVNAGLVADGTAGLALNYGAGGGVTYAYGFSANFTGPQGGQSLTINGQAYTLIYDAAQLQAITQTGLGGRYALATSFNAVATRTWGPYGFTPIGTVNGSLQGDGFTGTFDGLGNVVSNLFIGTPNSGIGLFGRIGIGGVVRNLGLSDVYINANQVAGALAGNVRGTVQNVWASGWVSGTAVVGGLVGINGGAISQSFSLVGVKARDSINVGGLVGENYGTIADTYVMGAILGGDRVGGLVGDNQGSITRSFFAGSVHGNSNVGPLVGRNQGAGTVTASLYDSTRSYFGGGLSTVQFQTGGGALATLGSAFAGGADGLYPYLKAFFPNGAQAVSGIAYKDQGRNPLISAQPAPVYSKDPAFVSLNAMGFYWGSVTTDRNGYYYFLVPAGMLAAGDSAAVYTNQSSGPDAPGTTNAFHLFTASGATVQGGVDLYGNTRTFNTAALLYSQTAIDTTALAQAIGGNTVAQAAYNGATAQRILATGASYTVDTPLSVAAGQQLSIETVAPGSLLILNAATTLASGGGLVLRSAGDLRIAAAITTADTTYFKLGSGGTMTIDAPITVIGGYTQGWTGSYWYSPDFSTMVLESAGAIRVNAVVTNRGANTFDIRYGGPDTNFTFARGGRLDYVNNFGNTIYNTATGGRALVINGEGYALISRIQDLPSMNGSAGRFALVANLGAGSYGSALIGSFSGRFDGLGHTIDNLTITGTGAQLGLFGTLASGSVVRNVGLNGGTIAGGAGSDVGALAGLSQGSIFNVWSSAAVIGTDGDIGGLVGENAGSIANSYVTGLVRGGGGTAGAIAGRNPGSVHNVLAAGLLFNTNASTGLVGDNSGVIDGALITGYANAGSTLLSAVGTGSGSVSNVYVDSDTTGFSSGGVVLTTAQLQGGGVPVGLSGDVWTGGTGGKYPYLRSFFPNGIDIVSGTARKADGSAWQAMITLAAGGAAISTVGSGANGYYYAFGAPGTLSAGQGLVAFTADGADALTFRIGSRNDLTSGFDLTETWRRDDLGPLASLSAAQATLVATAGSLTSGLTPANREISSGAAAFSIDQAVNQSGLLALKASGAVTQTAGVTAANLVITGAGDFTLNHAGNAVATVAASVGSLALTTGGALTVSSLSDGSGTTINGVTTTGAVTLSAVGDLTLAAKVSGASPVLSTRGLFINNQGSDGVIAASGRWLVYANSHLGNTFGSLDSQNMALFGRTLATAAPGAITQTGNRYVFANSPTITVAARNATKVYGEVIAPGGLPSLWADLVGAPSVAGVFLAPTIDALFPSLAVSSTGAAATAGVGTGYTLEIVPGSLASDYGYTVNTTSGSLTVTRRAITVTADALNRIYGNANPLLTYTIGGLGLVNGDSLTGSLTTGATTASGVGSYAITQGDLAASSNYDLTFVGANLQITPRALTVTADALSRIYGNTNPLLTYVVNGLGLVNGDTLTGALATGATTASGVGTYAITQGDLAASANYDLTFIGSNLQITPRALTVTADALSRIYGNTNPLLTYVVSGLGLVNGDTLTGALATGATTASGVGTYAITQGDLAASANYDLTFIGSNLQITPRALTVTADALSRIYGNTNPLLTYVVSGLGLVNGDTLTGALATGATTASGVGTYAITQGDLAASANYDLTFIGSNLQITPRALTVTADALSRIYGNTNPLLTYVVSGLGLVNGDTLTGALATGATTASGVGSYAITQGDLAASSNYDLTFVGATLAITPRAITVTADALSRIYGNANPLLTYTIGGLGLVNSDALSGALATGATTASGVGTYAITQGDLAASGNYDLTFVGSNLTVTPRAITITADALNRIYGNANPLLTYAVGGLGLVNGDSLSGALATGATTASGIGTYAISQGDLAASSNYDLTFIGSTLQITPRALTVTADALSRIYGNANPLLTYVVSGLGLVNGDSLSGALATGATTASGIGTYAISQGDLAASANYDLTFIGSNLQITPRALTVTADALSRIYGNTNPLLTYVVSGLGLVNGDTLTGALATGATTASGVGTYAVTQGDLAATANYDLTFVGSNLAITPRAITVTADALSRIYGNANPLLTYAVGGLGLVNGDTLSGALATGATTASGVGTYAVTQGDLAASGNYDLTFVGSNLTVTPRAITITADALSRIYGNANPLLTYAVGGLGLVNGDTLSGALATGATTASGVGTYAVTQGDLAASGNYDLTFVGSSLTVTPRAITITADALNRIYGNANPLLTYAVGGLGLVNGDSLTGALTTGATTASGVGSYAISQGDLAASANYDLTFVGSTLAITPRAITVTADALSRIYGNANPLLTYAVGGLGLVNGDTLSGGLATGATTASGVGTYAISQGDLAASANYDLTFVGSTLAITPRAITVTADALSRIYGNANPLLTYAVGGLGLVNGDTLSGALTTGATTASGVGSYAISQGDLAASSNYDLTFVGSTLAITPRAITVTADALSRIYGNANPLLTYAVGGLGLVNGDSLTGALATGATTASGVGTYAISQGDLAASANYDLTFVGSNLTVTPRAITVTADALSRIYGNANPLLTYAVGGLGLVNGDSLTGSLTTSATTASGVGSYAITQGSLTASANYTITFTGGGLTITPRPVTVIAHNQSRTQGFVNPPLTYSLGGLGLVNGDGFTGGLATDAAQGSPAGDYRIGRGDLSISANYAVTFLDGVMTVTAAPPPAQDGASAIQERFLAPYAPPALDPRPIDSGTDDDRVITEDPRLIAPLICSDGRVAAACVVASR